MWQKSRRILAAFFARHYRRWSVEGEAYLRDWLQRRSD